MSPQFTLLPECSLGMDAAHPYSPLSLSLTSPPLSALSSLLLPSVLYFLLPFAILLSLLFPTPLLCLICSSAFFSLNSSPISPSVSSPLMRTSSGVTVTGDWSGLGGSSRALAEIDPVCVCGCMVLMGVPVHAFVWGGYAWDRIHTWSYTRYYNLAYIPRYTHTHTLLYSFCMHVWECIVV